jgi:LAGLIDADG-like domain
LELVDRGLNDCEVARRTGISRWTVRDMRRYGDEPRHRNGNLRALTETCPRCWRWAKPMRFTPEDYAELLGLYLGDGSISHGARTDRLRIVLDTRYPGIIEDTRLLLTRCFLENRVHVGKGSKGGWPGSEGRCASIHLVCLFPQHGPGRKHTRAIALEPWQQQLVEAAPWAFIRGCIRSDGSVFVNRTGPYEYLSYEFGNHSEDIARLFVRLCDGLDLRPRINQDSRGRWDVRINRRESVARLLEHVGVKS